MSLLDVARTLTSTSISLCPPTGVTFLSCKTLNNFACKEAFSKVVGLGFRRGIALKEVEVLRDDQGKPFLSLSGKTKTITEKLGIKHLYVSISDTSELSSAFVIGE